MRCYLPSKRKRRKGDDYEQLRLDRKITDRNPRHPQAHRGPAGRIEQLPVDAGGAAHLPEARRGNGQAGKAGGYLVQSQGD